MTQVALDKTDLEILAILQADGRLSNQKIAGYLFLPPSRRIKTLPKASTRDLNA